jgi:hypothetical protein
MALILGKLNFNLFVFQITPPSSLSRRVETGYYPWPSQTPLRGFARPDSGGICSQPSTVSGFPLVIPAAGNPRLWPWRNAPSCDRNVAPRGVGQGTTGFARGAPLQLIRVNPKRYWPMKPLPGVRPGPAAPKCLNPSNLSCNRSRHRQAGRGSFRAAPLAAQIQEPQTMLCLD